MASIFSPPPPKGPNSHFSPFFTAFNVNFPFKFVFSSFSRPLCLLQHFGRYFRVTRPCFQPPAPLFLIHIVFGISHQLFIPYHPSWYLFNVQLPTFSYLPLLEPPDPLFLGGPRGLPPGGPISSCPLCYSYLI